VTHMKLIMENWDSYLSELKIEPKKAPMTWAQLKVITQGAALKAQGKLDKDREAQLLDVMGDAGKDLVAALLQDMIPFAGTLKSVGDAATKIFRIYAQKPDEVTANNPVLAAFNLSDGFQELIDDRLEEAFIEEKMPEVEQMASEAPNTPIPNMDEVIKQWLADRQIGNSTGNTVHNIAAGE